MQPDSLATCFHIGHEGGAFINGISALARVARSWLSLLPSKRGCSETLEVCNLPEGSLQIPTSLSPRSQTSFLQNCKK